MLKLTLKCTLIYINVSFNIFLEQSSCAFSWISKRRGNIKMQGRTVKEKRKKMVDVFIFVFEVSYKFIKVSDSVGLKKDVITSRCTAKLWKKKGWSVYFCVWNLT